MLCPHMCRVRKGAGRSRTHKWSVCGSLSPALRTIISSLLFKMLPRSMLLGLIPCGSNSEQNPNCEHSSHSVTTTKKEETATTERQHKTWPVPGRCASPPSSGGISMD